MFDFEIAQYFYNISKILTVFESNKFRAKAYYKAAMAIDAYDSYTEAAYKRDDLQRCLPLGASICKQVAQIIETGELVQLKELEEKYGIDNYDLLFLHGLGDKLKKKLWDNDIRSIGEAELNQSLIARALTRSEQDKLFDALQKYKSTPARFLYSQAYCLGNEIAGFLRGTEGVEAAGLSREFRISDDKASIIRLICFSDRSAGDLASALSGFKRLAAVSLEEAADQNITGYTKFGIPFEISLKSTSYWDDIYYSGEHPFFLSPKRYPIYGDLHAHSNFSDGISDIAALLSGAASRNYRYFAITDHSKSLKISNGLTETEAIRQHVLINELNASSPVKLLAGIEAEILEDGTLDYDDSILAQFDFVIAAIHTSLNQSALYLKQRIKKALANPYVNIFAHPTARLLGRPGNCFSERGAIPVDIEEIIEICKEQKVALEVNCFPERLDLSVNNARLAAQNGVLLSLGTDAHSAAHLNCMDYGVLIATEAGLRNEDILNCMEYDELLRFFSQKRGGVKSEKYILKDFSYYFSGNESIFKNCVPVVGIDLTGSEEKASGWALLRGTQTKTRLISKDRDLISQTIEANPRIISIDSPLTLPEGRCCADENCRCAVCGITRYCERMLMRFGIGVYPCLIPSMVNLTKRGIRLANEFKALGYRVIESYPGVAQDVLRIARKRKGLEHLIVGLESFGITGDLRDKPDISHDEVDAVTSALVGYFYINNQYVAMGNTEEDYLIIPRPQGDYLKRRVIIGLCGETAAGKTTLAEYLKFKYGFSTRRYSQIIGEMLPGGYDKKALQVLGAEIARDSERQRGLSRKILESIDEAGSYVIDGLRQTEDYEELTKALGDAFILIDISTPYQVRYKRYKESSKQEITLEEFLAMDNHESEVNIKKIVQYSKYILSNNKGYNHLFRQIGNIIKKEMEI